MKNIHPFVRPRLNANQHPGLIHKLGNAWQFVTAFRTFKRTRNNEDWESYKAMRNKTKQMLRNSKFRYIRNLNSETTNVKEIWQNFRNMASVKDLRN